MTFTSFDPNLGSTQSSFSDLPRRTLLALMLAAALPAAKAAPTPVEMWKSPTCGCCGDWVKHLQAEGFEVTVHNTGNTAIRARLGVPAAYGSCHTAAVGGYAVEGHVPARAIRRLLQEKPKAVGLAVAGMRLGSPGMDGPQYQGRKQPYDVVLVKADGTASIYQSY